MKLTDLQPGTRLLLDGEKFPDDEIEVIAPVGILKGRCFPGKALVRYVQRPVTFILGPEAKFEVIKLP